MGTSVRAIDVEASVSVSVVEPVDVVMLDCGLAAADAVAVLADVAVEEELVGPDVGKLVLPSATVEVAAYGPDGRDS